MKNMFGLLPDKLKFKYHAKGISKVIVDINTVLKPAVTVIDGFIAMEGAGPTRGDPVKMNTIIAGTDPVATDATGCRIMKIDPHTIRHTSAVHLLRSGVDINTIRAWLGHVSLDTTNIYAEVDLEMKAKALNHCEIFSTPEDTHWNKNPDLLDFLKSL